MPSACSAIASRPAVTCSPEATTASYSRASCIGEASRHHSTSSLVLPDIADTTTATSWPASTSRFTWRATLRIRSILATDVPPNFITRRPMTTGAFPERLSMVAGAQNQSAPPERRVYITARLRASNRVPAIPGMSREYSRFRQLRPAYGALYRRYPAARREGAVFHQCALDLLPAGDRGLDRGRRVLCGVGNGRRTGP